jgi:hypothetical protein
MDARITSGHEMATGSRGVVPPTVGEGTTPEA